MAGGHPGDHGTVQAGGQKDADRDVADERGRYRGINLSDDLRFQRRRSVEVLRRTEVPVFENLGVSAAEPLTTVTPAEQLPDPKQLEEERERFLRDFNSQVVANPLPPDSPTPAMHCDRHEKHPNSPAAANICQSCYDELQERVDVLEAAMHMDIREAAQIVYDAVWADTSDPSKTYQNAAQALMIELRRRSAITQVFGQLTPPIN